MPYVMSVIVSRAIPEIDGFKPSHRKILYTMYKMGLLTGPKTKSANVVGSTMKLHPHGDMAIYETMVRLTRGHEALLHPFVDSKGSFGKHYSDMAFAASRYTEVKLDPFCNEIFRGIDKNAVDFVPNYDNTLEEPTLLPTAFPNILVSPNTGIAVGMSSKICSFNLAEICDGTIMLLKRPYLDPEVLLDVIKAPDFSVGGYLLYDRSKLKEIYETGKGSVRLRAKYQYDKEDNCIEIIEIPYSTSLEIIIKNIVDLVKAGTLKEITDVRDESGLSGLKLALDIKRDVDPDVLMQKLYKLTKLEDNFACEFNVIINGAPKQLGVKGILEEWIKFRISCIRRETEYDLEKVNEKLHLLRGLAEILLDIDKAISIIRDTKNDKDVVPNLMSGFGIDEKQAEYVADIKLRALNNEYIANRIEEIQQLDEQARRFTEILSDESKIKEIIIQQLKEIKKKYGKPRCTEIIMNHELQDIDITPEIETYRSKVYFTEKGYFKKVKLTSLRMNDEHTLRDGDEIIYEQESDNTERLMFFTDAGQVYKSNVSEFEPCKASNVGVYVPTELAFTENEKVVGGVCVPRDDDSGNVVFIFRNGKGVKIPLASYATKANRKKLTGALSTDSPCVYVGYEKEPYEIVLLTDNGRGLAVSTENIPVKTTRTSSGVTLMTLKAKNFVTKAERATEEKYPNLKKMRKSIPSSGVIMDKQ
ncbi:MAG: topoisomerase IV [Ruminococcaceae bacterium]|nr:topoisomerase IV [Oscillospiraceae bacterium]